MKRTALAAATAAVLLLLAGCSGGGDQVNVAVNTATPTATAQEESAAPLVAETPAATQDSGEAAFLDEVRAEIRPDNVIPDATDAQLLAAGERACAEIAAGTPTDQISVIDAEPTNALGTYSDSAVIITAAATTICD